MQPASIAVAAIVNTLSFFAEFSTAKHYTGYQDYTSLNYKLTTCNPMIFATKQHASSLKNQLADLGLTTHHLRLFLRRFVNQ